MFLWVVTFRPGGRVRRYYHLQVSRGLYFFLRRLGRLDLRISAAAGRHWYMSVKRRPRPPV